MNARHFALPAAVLCLVLSACDDDDEPRSPGAGTPGAVGQSFNGPFTGQSIDGPWVVTTTPVSSSCGPISNIIENVMVLSIVQAGNEFDFNLEDDCGNPIPGGTGTIDPSGAVSFATLTSRRLSATCVVNVTTTWSGLARTSSDVISGSAVMNAAATPGLDNCTVPLPCTAAGSFRAEPCPGGNCAVTCTP